MLGNTQGPGAASTTLGWLTLLRGLRNLNQNQTRVLVQNYPALAAPNASPPKLLFGGLRHSPVVWWVLLLFKHYK